MKPTTILRAAMTLSCLLGGLQAQATTIRLETATATVEQGGAFLVRILADIDPADEIIGFGFDLDADSGIRLLDFSAGSGFADDPIYLAPFSDADRIRGASGGSLLFGPPISGSDVLLGTLRLQALTVGTALVGLGADDLSFTFTEGLIPLDPSIPNFLPQVAPLTIDVVPSTGVPEPGTLLCAAAGLYALLATGRRRPAAGVQPAPGSQPGIAGTV